MDNPVLHWEIARSQRRRGIGPHLAKGFPAWPTWRFPAWLTWELLCDGAMVLFLLVMRVPAWLTWGFLWGAVAMGLLRHARGFPAWLTWTLRPRDYYLGGLILEILWLYGLYHTTSAAALRVFLNAFAGGADFGHFCLNVLYLQHFALAILVTIISLTSAFNVEKSRGILHSLMSSNLTPAEIVLGKFIARVGQVGWLLLTGMPVLCFIGVPGGINLSLVFVGAAITAGLLFGFGAVSIYAAVRCRKGSNAFLIVASISGLVVFLAQGLAYWTLRARVAGASYAPLLAGLDTFLQLWDPFPLWEAASSLPSVSSWLGPTLLWLTVWLISGGVFLALAVASLRPVYLRDAEKSPRTVGRLRSLPPVSDNPVLWKARYVEPLAIAPGLRGQRRFIGVAAIFAGASIIIGMGLFQGGAFNLQGVIFLGSFCMTIFLSAAVAYHTTQTILREKESGTLDELRLTGIEPSALVRGKIRGIFIAALPYFLASAVPSLIGSAFACLCVLLTGPGWGQERTKETFRDVAGRMVKAINAADYEGIRKDFNKGMLEAFPVEKCRTFFSKEILGKFGKINELEPPQFKSKAEAVFVARCERGTLDVTLVLDDRGRVAGMWFLPAPTPGSWSPSLLATLLYLALCAVQLYAAIVVGFFLSMRLKNWWQALLATLVMIWVPFLIMSSSAIAGRLPPADIAVPQAIFAVLIVLPFFGIFVLILMGCVRFLIEAFATRDPSQTLRQPPPNNFPASMLWPFYKQTSRGHPERCWNQLGDPDDVRGERAMSGLVGNRIEALALLKERLHPVPPVDPQWIEQLLQEAESDDGAIQDKACQELASLDGVVESHLMKRLLCPTSERRRDQTMLLLEKIELRAVAQELHRRIRAVEVLEQIAKQNRPMLSGWSVFLLAARRRTAELVDRGMPGPRKILRSLAEGAPEAPLTQAAKAALQRLGVANGPRG